MTEAAGRSASAMQVPVPPRRWPGLGHIPAMMSDPLGFLTGLAGFGGVVRLQLATRPIYVVTAPDLVHQLLTAHAGACPRSGVHTSARRYFGEGLLMIDGEQHRGRRRALQSCFRKDRIDDHLSVMQSVAEEHTAQWQPNQLLSMEREMYILALDIVTISLFGTRLNGRSATDFLAAFPNMIRGLVLHALYPHKSLGRLPLPVNRRFAESVRVMNRIAEEIVETAADDPLGIIAVMRRTHPEEVVRAEVITMLFAGTETSGATLNWLFHELDRHPAISRAVVTELDAELSDNPELTAAHLDRLTITRRVVREVLRCHTPNAFLMRKATTSTQLGPYTVPAGAELMYCLTALHRNPGLYPDPLRFDPDRWLPESATDRKAYLPFAAGIHKCIGEEFAWSELMIVAATVLRHWVLTTEPDNQVHEVVGVTVQAKGLVMRAMPRR
jgi:cytochrome P450